MALKKIDKYKIEEEVGRGGMAVVYRATDTSLGREVALKLLHPYLTEDAQARSRLEYEAKAVASLKHPLIPDVYDFSGVDSKHAYIVTEFVNGITLASFMEKHKFELVESALLVVHQITTALNHAHTSGIIHRDLKPENIMINKKGQVKLMDFGISRVVANPGITSTGQILGSPAFMAPEIIKGRPAIKESDIFSMGILLYRLATGELPFSGSNPHAVLIKIAETDFPDPEFIRPHIGSSAGKLIRKCLAQEPVNRTKSSLELLESIEKILEYSGIKKNKIASLCSKLLKKPQKTEEYLKERVIKSLLSLSYKSFNSPLGQQTISRLLYLDPENEEVKTLFEKLQRKQKKNSIQKIALIVIICLIIISIPTYFLLYTKIGKTNKTKIKAKNKIATSKKPFNRTLDSTLSPIDNNMSLSNMDSNIMDPPVSFVKDGSNIDTNMKIRPINTIMKPMKYIFRTKPLMAKFPDIIKERTFILNPFPQGQITIVLDGKVLGLWGPRSPGISYIKVTPGEHILKLKHPLCYSQTIKITPKMNSSKIARRLHWRPARVLVNAPTGSAIAVKVTEGLKRTVSGIPNSPLEVAFPHIWNSPVMHGRIIVAGKNIKTKEKDIILKAGKLIKINMN